MTLRISDSRPVPGRRARALALAVAGVLATGAASAQQAPAGSDTGGMENLGEIVVTAQKREQRLQEVPIAISVVSGDVVDKMGGFNAESLKTLVPSLNIRKTNTSLNQSLFLRGVGTINFAIAAQPRVAFVQDGVVLSSAGEAFGDLYDVDRVEVLRGPQGTLFGKNASAGVVNVVSKMPGDEFGGYVDLQYFEDDEKRVKAALDAPLSDTLRTRTTVTWGQFDGYLDNVSATPAGGPTNGYDRWGLRSIWVADPTDNVRLTFIGDYRKSDDNCCVEIVGPIPAGANAAALRQLLSGTDFATGEDSRTVRQNQEMRSEEEAWGLSAQADVSFGDYTLTSITAYRTWDATEFREGDWLDQTAPYVGNAFAQLHDFGPQTQETISQELRLASPAGGFLEYVAGVFYSRTEAQRLFQRNTVVCRSTTLPVDATGLAPCTPAASVIQDQFAVATFDADFDNLALFADGTFNVSDRWRVIAGLRWTQDDLSFNHRYTFSPRPGPGIRDVTDPECTVGGVVCAGNTRLLTGENDASEVSGRAGLQFDVTDDFMAYATYARGYKGPAFNVFFNMRQRDARPLEAEIADSFEIGFKSTLAGGRLLLNAAVFDAKYDNFQANNFLVLNGVTITTLQNAGEVSSQGAEIDFLARPTDALSITGGLSYTKAEVDRFFLQPGITTPPVRNGTQLPLAPEIKGSVGVEYRFELATIDVVPSLLYAYTDDQFADLNENPITLIPSFSTVDLSIAFASKDDRYRLTLVGRNLTDESFAALVSTGGPGGAPRLQIPRDADRYFGAQFRVNFGAN
ncbi:MAG: TonB-dependent receptor [Pseudomonadota bacterium]